MSTWNAYHFSEHLVSFALERKVLSLGKFRLKSGRTSPYFFNMGALCEGDDFTRLGAYYAEALQQEAPDFDVLFGPAYKGIPLVTATACALRHNHGRSVGVAYNRKEEKDHGEGGSLVGANLEGKRVVLLDDVITAGTALTHASEQILQAGGKLVAVVVAFNRQERGSGEVSAVEQMRRDLGVPIISLARLDDLVEHLKQSGEHAKELRAIEDYRASAVAGG